MSNAYQIYSNYLFAKAGLQGIPLSGTFELTARCNLDCRMCYIHKRANDAMALAGERTAAQWLALAEECRTAGTLLLLLTGGEPMLRPDFREIYTGCRRLGLMVSINSNAVLIDEDMLRFLAADPPSRINITLYGASPETYGTLCGDPAAYERAVRAILALQSAGVLVKLNCSLTPHNAGDLEGIVSYAAERDLILEVNTYMFPPLRRDPTMVGRNDRFTPAETAHYHMERYRLQRGEEDFTRFLQNILRGIAPPPGLDEDCVDPVDGTISCRAGNASFWVTWDGWLTPCGMMPKPRIELKGKPFREAWSELTRVSAAQRLSGTCTGCQNRRICHSCAAMAMAETGSVSGIPKYLCEMVWAMRTEAARLVSLIDDIIRLFLLHFVVAEGVIPHAFIPVEEMHRGIIVSFDFM